MLSVRVNDWPLGLVAHFDEVNGRLSLPAEQFDGLGFKLDEAQVTTVDGQRRVYLDQLPGVTWRIDMRAQTIDITAPFDLLKPNVLRVAPGISRVESRSNWGAMVAYDVYGEYSSRSQSEIYSRSLSVNVEGRIFSPWFLASTSGFYVTGEGEEGQFIRLDSRIDFDNVESAWRLRLGDSITIGPVWVRTLRFGGLQWSRDFSLRPDIVTMPIPVVSQNVSVPSTVDVFINEVHRYSQAVTPGALRVADLPVVTGSNTVSVVVTDQAGRRVQLVLPLYASSDLLAPGISTFNLEAGAERLQYASVSNDYGRAFVSGSFGYGISDRLTVRGYGAGSHGYWTAAAGATVAVGRLFQIDSAAMVSDGPAGQGWALYGAIEHVSGSFNIFASYLHASRDFRDLVANFGYTNFTEQATASAGVNFGRFGQFNVAYVMQRSAEDRSSILSGTYGFDLFRRQVHLSASGYAELESGDWGLTLSINFPIGRNAHGYVDHSWNNGALSSSASLRGEAFRNRLDWEIAGEQGGFEEVSAEVGWDSERIDARIRAANSHGEFGFRGELAQSLVLMDNRLVLAGRIDDGFAIVDVEDSPGIRVALENQTVGRTNSRGRLFVTGLNSYVGNAISIDPLDLPIDRSISDTSMLVSPRAGGGLVARFAVNHENAAIVVLQRPDGTPPPVGAEVRLEGNDNPAILGHGGEVYVRGLAEGSNHLNVSWREGQCSVNFTAQVASGTLPRLGPFACVP